MRDEFTRNVAMASVFALGLLLLDPVAKVAAHAPGPAKYAVMAIHWLHNGELNADDFHTLAGNYYEGIERNVRISPGSENDDYLLRGDFLRYEFKPNLKRKYEAGMRITNSLGMPNPEYGYDKPAQTRRIALLGDSLSTGPYGLDYRTLLEDRLNRGPLPAGVKQIQILNFAVPGYIVAQKLDVALEKVPKFHPDAYILQLSSQELGGIARHMGRLVAEGIDFKYDFLRQTAARAGVRPDDRRPIVNSKLAPYFGAMMQWAVAEIRNHAAAEHAPVLILYLPAVIDADISASDFDQIRKVTDGFGLPTIDLRDTFRGADFPALQVVPKFDVHPNAAGHKMIFDDFYARLQSNQDAMAALLGDGTNSGAPKQ